uniref:G-protein coupled receptors family 1 profile domain-containing protein n=1 Tax=Pyxicephalus adspersus TaxID=30357 RepID=A0AAV3A267_PYXAD|nr:TPA: hypothetical protein GDO54_017488 [Pyxicephalus adspersus]
MEERNITWPSEFILLGFYEWPHLQPILFVIFLLIYFIALIGNLFLTVVIFSSSNLHTPMYFFLCNLSILDIIQTSNVMPKILDICLTKNQSISYLGCLTQVFLFVTCVVVQTFLLAAMAYDRYVAICCPLRYTYLMNMTISLHLAIISWGFGFVGSVVLIGFISHFTFTRFNIINSLLCDQESLLKLTTSNIREIKMAALILIFIFGFIPLAFIIVTYVFVIYNILKIHSNRGKRKAFSTCSSQLTVIILYLGILLKMYLRPNSGNSVVEGKIVSMMYITCIPTLNPVIYSLRNKDVHMAVKKLRSTIHGRL